MENPENKVQVMDIENSKVDFFKNPLLIDDATMKLSSILMPPDISMFSHLTGGLADFSIYHPSDILSSVPIQVKGLVYGEIFNIEIDKYKGLSLLLLDFRENLYLKLINSTAITEMDLNDGIVNIFLIPSYEFGYMSNCETAVPSHRSLQLFLVNRIQLQDKMRLLLRSDNPQPKRPLSFWDNISLNQTNKVEREHFYKITQHLLKLNISVIPVNPSLPFDFYISRRNQQVKCQMKTEKKDTSHQYVCLYAQHKDIRYYKKDDFQLLIITSSYAPGKFLFIPNEVLERKQLIGSNVAKGSCPVAMYAHFLEYEIDFNNFNAFNSSRLDTILNSVENSQEINDALSGHQVRNDPQFLLEVNLNIDKSQATLLEEYKNIINIDLNEFKVNSDYASILFYPGVNIQKIQTLNKEPVTRFECSTCKNTYLRKDSCKRHIEHTANCKTLNSYPIKKLFEVGTVDVPRDDTIKRFKCCTCNKKFSTKACWTYHKDHTVACNDASVSMTK